MKIAFVGKGGAGRGRWYGGLVIGLAVAAVAVLLALPAPQRRVVPAPPTLASVWPDAHPFPIPGFLPDGSTYRPQRLLDPATSVGVVTGPDGVRTSLVLLSAGQARVLQAADSALFQGIGYTTDRLFWMLTAVDPAGRPSVGLWTALRARGAATLLTSDVGLPLLLGSAYDIEAVDGRLYWTSTYPDARETELRSVPLAGGPVRVEPIPGAWTMSAWPWLVSAPTPGDAPTRLYDLTSRRTVTVKAPAHQQISCSPVWCRLVPPDGSLRTELVRPDGSDRHPVRDQGALPVSVDVAARDRFEPLLLTATAAGGIGARLVLYDLTTDRSVLIAPNVSDAKADVTHLWWATGDNETLTWYGLDLRTLS